jgi:hypothetical protein
MSTILITSVRSEWLKTRRSLASWLVAGGGLFVPIGLMIVRIHHVVVHHAGAPGAAATLPFWETLWNQAWQLAAVMVIPLSAILIVSVVTQIEARANGWKQVEATPQPRWVIFLAKLLIVLALFVIQLGWLNLGLIAAAWLPGFVVPGAPRPSGAFSMGLFAERNIALLVNTLPVIGIQYLVALRWRSFLPPFALGMSLWILSASVLTWRFNYVFPYVYGAVEYIWLFSPQATVTAPLPVQAIATLAFLASSALGYVLFLTRTDRG